MNAEKSMKGWLAVAFIMVIAFAALGAAIAEEADAGTEGATTETAPASTAYTVTWISDGKTIETQAYIDGQALTAPADPAKTGYKFIGWSATDKATKADTLPATVTASVTYYAVFEANNFTVAFVVDGITVATTDQKRSVVPSDPAKAGYDFAGWSATENGTAIEKIKDYIKALDADSTVYALWTPTLLSVVFMADGETVLTESVQYDKRAIEPAVIPSKDGYTFKGWSADGTTIYDFGTAVQDNLVLSAVYEAVDNPATVTYIVDGLRVSDPETPAKEGYTFVGWSDGTQIVKADDLAGYIAALPAGANVVLTAIWDAIVYTVTFTADGQTVLTQSVRYGELATEPAVQPTRDGYAFAGWDYDFATPITANTAIEAVFEPLEAPATVTYIVDGLTVKSAETPAKVGYRFIGWSDGSQVVTDIPAYIAALPAGADVTLTAVFEAEVYTVTFTADGQVFATQSVKYGELATKPADVPTNIDFKAWDWDFATPITQDTTIAAIPVEVIVYTVTFDYGYPGVDSVAIDVENGKTVPADAFPPIYPYMGNVEWSVDADTVITSDVTATLQAVSAPVKSDDDNGVIVEVAVIVVIFAVLAIAAVVCIKQGIPAKIKAKNEAKKAARASKNAPADAGKEQPKP